ncbi:MAG TPA: hypothetical protein DIU04_10365 [Pseudomonas sp.]|nr:hypothetical protein [Pseudomonas sp.]
MVDLRIDPGLVVWRKLLDGLRCFAPLSIPRVLVIIGGRGRTASWLLTNRPGIGGVAQIARRIALLRAAIHPPGIFDYWGAAGRRLGVLTDRLGIGGVAQIVRRIALLRAAIHPPGVVIIWAWAAEDGIRVVASVMADFLVGAVCLWSRCGYGARRLCFGAV